MYEYIYNCNKYKYLTSVARNRITIFSQVQHANHEKNWIVLLDCGLALHKYNGNDERFVRLELYTWKHTNFVDT
jgi:hypothetical protein